MVVATMEATPVPAPQHFEQNGVKTVDLESYGAGPPKAVVGPVELPSGKRLSGAMIAALAALAGVGAILLSSWAFVSSVRSDEGSTSDTAQSRRAVSVLSKPSTQRVPVDGSAGRMILAVESSRLGYLVLDGFGHAPSGKSYQAWVIRPNAKTPVSAAVFSGKEMLVPLSIPVRPGGAIAITIERAGGAPAPTHDPKLLARPIL